MVHSEPIDRAAADSVYAYLERMAEPVAEGTRWQTKDYQNKLGYSAEIFDGVAGITLFLSDYFRLRGVPRALELARGALQWCSAQSQAKSDQPPTNEQNSLYSGKAGLGTAWLRLAEAAADREALKRAVEVGDELLQVQPGPLTDLLLGSAGQGIFLLRLGEASGQSRFQEGAIRIGAWLESIAQRDANGVAWDFGVNAPGRGWAVGFSHGVAGITYFFLLLHQLTGQERWVRIATQGLGTLDFQAKADRGGLNWPTALGKTDLTRVQWCHGAPGIGWTYLKAAEVLRQPASLETARQAGEATFNAGDLRKNPSQCHGLAGNAELLLELYRVTREPVWKSRALDFARRILAYRHTGPDGDLWPSDVAGIDSPDFMCGGAGAGYFFLRLETEGELRPPLI